MSFVVPLVYFILANGLFVYIFKKSFDKCLPLTMMIITIIYFFSQVLFKTFKIGYIINLLLPIIFLILLIYRKITKKDLKKIKKQFFNKGFYAFILIYIFVYIFNLNRNFSVWDEFSHWGVMVKEMMRLDKFYSVNLSTLMAHKDYPPIIQIYEMFFAQISGGYSEATLVRAIQLLSFSLFIPSFCDTTKKINKSNFILKTIFIILSIFLTIMFFDQHGIINTIYIDYIMAIIVVYLFSIVIFETDTLTLFNLIRLSIGSIFLILTKQMALPLYIMFLFMFIMDIILKNRHKLKNIFYKNNIFKCIQVIVLVIIIPISCWSGWNNYINHLEITRQFELSDLKISELGGIVSNTDGETWQQLAADNYLNAIKTKNMTTSYITLSYFECLIVTLLILFILYFLSKNIFNKEKIPLLAITLTIGYFGYAFVMLVMYCFSFGPREGPILASFDRYLPTFVLICMLILVSIFIYLDNNKDPKSQSPMKLIVLFIILFIIQHPVSMQKFVPQIKTNSDNIYLNHAINIKDKVEDNSKVFIIAQDSDGRFQFYIKYYLDTITTNLHHYNLPVNVIDDYEIYFEQNVEDYMLEFDYLYLAQINDKFIERYKFLFEDNTIETGKLYKINKENNKLKLDIIN